MLDSAPSILRGAVIPRLVLLANHVLASEPAATQRLVPTAGRRIDVVLADLPAPLAWAAGAFVEVALRITPAGLLEWVEQPGGASDLVITIDASNPLAAALRAAAGERPPVRIEGDASLAAEVSWLLDNLRWDLEDDLGRLIGPAAAHQFARAGQAVSPALRRFAAAAAGVAEGLGAQAPGGARNGTAEPQGPAPR